jgi:hypothetical protein
MVVDRLRWHGGRHLSKKACMCGLLSLGRVMSRRHTDYTKNLDLCRPWQTQLMAKPFLRVFGVPELQKAWGFITDLNAEQIHIRWL